MDSTLVSAVYAVLGSFFINVLLCPIIIPYLEKLKLGQYVRDDGPKKHIKKSGTPTMGGIMILLSFVLTSIFFLKNNPDGLMVVFVSLAFGVIGFLDDYIKVVKKRSLGLRAYQKIIAQLIVTSVFAFYIYNYSGIGTEIIIPFTNSRTLDLGIFYLPFVFFVMIGCVNSVNLTDGLDGLASGVTVLVATFFLFVSWAVGSGISPVCGAAVGSLLGFLLFNSYPAKIFMGDTGSLALGGFIASVALILKMPLLLALVGFIYVAESLSVIIQVGYFKLTHGKRIFKMAPLHHHFELSGFSETKVVTLFYVITAILCLIGFLGTKNIYL